MPELVDALKKKEIPTAQCIEESGVLRRQKQALIELTLHPELTPVMRESLGARLLEEEQQRMGNIVKWTDMIAVGTGSACASGDIKPSHVLMAARGDAEVAHSSIRFSLGIETTRADIMRVMEVLPKVVRKLQCSFRFCRKINMSGCIKQGEFGIFIF